MATKSPKVLIVGAGPSGLVLALSLLKNGIPVRIIEKDPEYYSGIFRGSGISPRTQEVLHFLGVLDEVKKLAVGPPTLHVYDQNDTRRIVKSIDFIQDYKPTPAFPITRVAILGQSRHQAILRKYIEALDGQVELSTEFSSLKQDEAGVKVTLTKTNGNTKTEETAKFAYVIGTDGGRSAVRKSLGLEFFGETKDLAVLLADVQVEGFDGTGMHKWGEANKNVVQLYNHGEPGMYQLLAGGPWFDLQAVMVDDSLERLQQEFTKCVQRPEIKIIKIYSKGEWRPNIRMATRFKLGRVFLAGDAAHTHPPTGGQGLNTSVMDSFNLGWKLALVLNGHSLPSLLDTYESERMPVVAEMLKISTSLLNVAYHENRDTQEAFRKAQEEGIIAKGAKADELWTRGWKLTQLDVNYRHSPILLDEFAEDASNKEEKVDAYESEGHALQAGDRAPEATGLLVVTGPTHSTRMFDIFTPTHHTVLVFPTTDGAETQTFVDSINDSLKGLAPELIRTFLVLPKFHSESAISGVDFIVQDTDGYAFAHYGIKKDVQTVIIVRPDAYIGGIAKGSEGVKKYFSLVLNSTA